MKSLRHGALADTIVTAFGVLLFSGLVAAFGGGPPGHTYFYRFLWGAALFGGGLGGLVIALVLVKRMPKGTSVLLGVGAFIGVLAAIPLGGFLALQLLNAVYPVIVSIFAPG